MVAPGLDLDTRKYGSEQGEDVPEVRHDSSVVSPLCPKSPLGRVGDLPRARGA